MTSDQMAAASETDAALEPPSTGRIAIVMPAFDEVDSLDVLIPEVLGVADATGIDLTLLVVDDGSRDGTPDLVAQHGARDERVRVLPSRINRGKAHALRRGFKAALADGADVVVMMDADGQDDPAELPALLAQLADGADLVTGARTSGRRDRYVKRHTSRLYNATTRIVSRTPGTDNNSGFKAMRAEVARSLVPMLYGEYHRYLTVIAHRAGFVIDQVDVRHRARTAGVSKYGVARFWRGFVDLLSIRFLLDYQHRPQHLFAGIGAVTSVVGAVILGVLVVQWLLGSSIGDRPLLIAGVLLFLAGLQMLLFGLLAELVVAGRHRDRAWLDDEV